MKAEATGVRLYVYYRVPTARLAEVTGEALALSSALMQGHPGLHVDVLQRANPDGNEAMLMEIYSALGGITPALADAIEQAASRTFAGRAGARRAEAFVPVASPQT